jgi:cell division septum initiation protein DivIVA
MNRPTGAAAPPVPAPAKPPKPAQPPPAAIGSAPLPENRPMSPPPSSPPPSSPAAVPELTGEDAYLIDEKIGLHAYSGFESSLRGYDRRQVDRYVTRTQRRIDELTAELAVISRRERELLSRVEDLSSSASHCTCGPDRAESEVVGVRLRQILGLAHEEAEDARRRAEEESQAMREEATGVLAQARRDAERAAADFEIALADRRAAEAAKDAERRAAVDGWADQRVGEARETARRLIEHASGVSGQVVASARWLVDALGAHRDALTEQLNGVRRRIEALPAIEPAAAVAAADRPSAPARPAPPPTPPRPSPKPPPQPAIKEK